jgi:hypothetical protein
MALPRIEHPTWELEIPSKKEKVKMRDMLVREEKILLQAKEGDEPAEILNAVKTVVQNCVETPGVSVDDWAIFDIEYAFLKLRAHSVSEIAETAYIDNDEVDTDMEGINASSSEYDRKLRQAQAQATRTFKIDLNEVKIKFPEKIESQIKVNNKVGIHLKYPPASLYSDKEFMQASGDDLVHMLVQKSIDTIYDGKEISYDKTHPAAPGEMKEFVESLDVKVYNKMKDFFNNLPHLEHEIKYTNKNGKDRTITLTTLGDFFQL